MSEQQYVAGPVFSKIETDSRVTPDLMHCIYCYVTCRDGDSRVKQTDYKILLETRSEGTKQCPSCKKIYILKDPTEWDNAS